MPLDIVVASKIGAPGNAELAIGGVASDESVWRNEEAFHRASADEEYFEQQRQQEAENARRTADRYRGDQSDHELTGKTVAVVDDGVATGATVRACLQKLRRTAAEHIVLAVPDGPPDSLQQLRERVDTVVCLQTPSSFRGVGQFYELFEQVSDEKAIAYLEA